MKFLEFKCRDMNNVIVVFSVILTTFSFEISDLLSSLCERRYSCRRRKTIRLQA